MAANVHASFLTRFTDLWFVAGQLTDRSSLSVFGSVWVNSGPIAAYRAEVIRDNLTAYLTWCRRSSTPTRRPFRG